MVIVEKGSILQTILNKLDELLRDIRAYYVIDYQIEVSIIIKNLSKAYESIKG